MCALVRRVSQPGESDPLLSERMSAEFEKKESIVKFFTGISTATNEKTGRIESLEERNKKPEPTEKKVRKERRVLKCRLSEAALSVFNRINSGDIKPHPPDL